MNSPLPDPGKNPKSEERLRKMLALWRGVPVEIPDKPIVSLQDLIQKELKSLRLDKRLNEEEVAHAWTKTAGPSIAKLTSPNGIRAKVLYIRAANAPLMATLNALKGDYLSKMQGLLGKERIKEIRFKVG